ncbi:hypothetical protein MAHJHV55_51720 [Mycobacterium avium subsp. hominissuis]
MAGGVNIGNPTELTVLSAAELIRELAGGVNWMVDVLPASSRINSAADSTVSSVGLPMFTGLIALAHSDFAGPVMVSST